MIEDSYWIRRTAALLDREFPLRVMRIGAHGTIDLHRHQFHELVVVLGGTGRHLTSEGDYGLSAGDVFLIRGDLAHGYQDTHQLSIVNILFLPRVLGLPMGDLEGLPGYQVLFRIEPRFRKQHRFRGRLHLDPEQLAEAAQWISRLDHELNEKPPGYRFLAKASLMSLIGFLSRVYTDTDATERRTLFALGKVLSHIEHHYDDSLSVARLAELAGMSESSLMRAFRKGTGTSPMDYVIQVRINKAAQWLQKTDMRVTEIAFRCGFNDSNYFSRTFRKLMHHSPRTYRRRAAEPHTASHRGTLSAP